MIIFVAARLFAIIALPPNPACVSDGSPLSSLVNGAVLLADGPLVRESDLDRRLDGNSGRWTFRIAAKLLICLHHSRVLARMPGPGGPALADRNSQTLRSRPNGGVGAVKKPLIGE